MSRGRGVLVILFAILLGVGLWVGNTTPGVDETDPTEGGRRAVLDSLLAPLDIPPASRGGWTLYVFFSLSDCGGCLSEAATWQSLHQDLSGEGLQVMGVGQAQDRDRLEAFCRDEEITFPVIWNPQEPWKSALGLSNTPHKVLVDPAGGVVLEDPPNNSLRRQRRFEKTVKEMINIHS